MTIRPKTWQSKFVPNQSDRVSTEDAKNLRIAWVTPSLARGYFM